MMIVEKLSIKKGMTDLRTIATGSKETCFWVMAQDFIGTMGERYDVDTGSVYEMKKWPNDVPYSKDELYACLHNDGAVIIDGKDRDQWIVREQEGSKAVLVDIKAKDNNSYLLAYEGELTKDEALNRLHLLVPGYANVDDMFSSASVAELHQAGFWILLPVGEEKEETRLAGYRFIEDFTFTDVLKLTADEI